MASGPRRIRIFLASPSDVVEEREDALRVLELLDYDPLLRQRIGIEQVAWDKPGAGAPILAGLTPQDSLAKGLPRPAECDIVVVIFWSRMGTPLPTSYLKPEGGRYESGTEWEYEDAVAAFEATGSPFVLLYRRAEKVLLDPADEALNERLDQYRKVERFFARFRNADGSISSGYTSYVTLDGFRKQLEHDLKSLIVRILETSSSRAIAPAMLPAKWSLSPFPGLRAFMTDDASIFFGRDREIDMLLSRVKANSFVAVVGASGSGKSSLVAAGLIPRLRATASATSAAPWLTITFTPDQLGSGDPFASVASAVLHAMPAAAQPQLATLLGNDPQMLARLLVEHSGARQVLIFVDQFEELFTTIRPPLREPFVDMLAALTHEERLRTIITVRGDFYGRCVEQEALARLLESGTVPLSAPGSAALYDMIVRPATLAALTFEESLPLTILEDTGQQPGALALMAYTLDELHRRSGQHGRLTRAIYDEIGGVQGAIGKRSEAVFASLGEEERHALPHVFRELVEVDEQGNATRQRAARSRVADTPAADRLIDELTAARLLVQSRGDDNVPTVEVAHEALFRTWPRMVAWIRDTEADLRILRQVRNGAREWDANGRRDDFLWSYERLAPFYVLRERLDIALEPFLEDFVQPEGDRILERMRSETREFLLRSYLERLIEIGPAAARALVQSLQYATSEEARNDVTIALVAMEDVAVPALLEACQAANFRLREAAVTALALMASPPASPIQERLLEDSVPEVRAAAIHLVTALGDPTIIPVLVKRLDDPVPELRALAVLAAASFDDDRAFDTVGNAVRRDLSLAPIALDLARHLAGKDQSRRLSALAGQAGKRVLPFVDRTVLSPRSPQHIETLLDGFLSQLRSGRLSESTLRALIEIGTSSAMRAVINGTRNFSFADFFSTIEPALDERTLPATIVLLDDKSAHVRERVALVIRELADVKNPSLPLAEIFRKHNVASALLRCARAGRDEIEIAALSALSAMREESAHPIFREALHSKNESIRTIAAEGLGRTNGKVALPELILLLSDVNLNVRMAAADALIALDGGIAASEAAVTALNSIAHTRRNGQLKMRLIELVRARPSLNAKRVLERVRSSKSPGASKLAAKALRDRPFTLF